MISKEAINSFLNRQLDEFEWVKKLSLTQLDLALKESVDPHLIEGLWRHQKMMLLIMQHNPRFMLLAEMGGGKSRTILTHIRNRKAKGEKPKAIVFVPYLTAVDTWMNETAKFAPELVCCPLMGSSEENLYTISEVEADLYPICYQSAVALFSIKQKKEGKKKAKWTIDASLVKQITSKFDTMILDECHRAQSHNSLTFDICNTISNNVKWVYGLTGTPFGNAQPLDSKILTPKGWVRMGDIKIGDLVINELGTYTKVIGVYPHPAMNIYEVLFNDGTKTQCCENHLWAVYRRYQRENSKGSQKLNYRKEPYILSLRDIMKNYISKKTRRIRNYSIPVVKPVLFDSSEVPLDPYILGCLLGDGSFVSGPPGLASIDMEIISEFRRLLPDCKISQDKNYSEHRSCKWRIVKKNNTKNNTFPNPLVKTLKRLSLFGKSGEQKFVPECYLFNSIEIRLSILQGLMDTDGTVTKDGTASFCNTNFALCKSVQFLFNSLGGTAKILGPYRHKGINREHYKSNYYVHGQLPNDYNPFRLKRKADLVNKNRKQRNLYRAIDKIEMIGKEEVQCITVESTTGLYITDDFIVTHNSFQSLWAEFFLVDKGETLGPNISFFREVFFVKKYPFWGGVQFIFKKKLKNKLQTIIKNKSIHFSTEEMIDLPEKHYIPIKMHLRDGAKNHVEKALKDLHKAILDKDVKLVGTSFLALRQLSSGFLTFKGEDEESKERIKVKLSDNPKLDALCGLIEDMPYDTKMVIFHDYVYTNELISERLTKLKIHHARIWGGQKDPLGELKKFREDTNCKILVINSRSGSSALNLQFASIVVFYECPSVIDRAQAEARCWRPGQTKKVQIYDLLVKGTLDEDYYTSVRAGGDLMKEFLTGKKKLRGK